MKIYNKTNQVQELRVYDRGSHLPYSIYVCAKSTTTLAPSISTPDLPKLVSSGIFEIVGMPPKEESRIPAVEESITPEETSAVETDVTREDVLKVEESESTEESKFICDICHSEFASARSLSMHMKKSHSDSNKKEE